MIQVQPPRHSFELHKCTNHWEDQNGKYVSATWISNVLVPDEILMEAYIKNCEPNLSFNQFKEMTNIYKVLTLLHRSIGDQRLLKG